MRLHTSRWGLSLPSFRLFGVTVLLLAAGCSGIKDPLGRQALSGSVTLDGAPLEYGTVRFEPFGATGKSTSSGAIITSGRYSISAADGLPAGKYTVTVSSSGGPPKPTTTDPVEAMSAAAKEVVAEEKIPERYNTATELVVEITQGKPGQFDFKLTSDKK